MTRIYALVDAQGLPIRLGITAGQAHDGPAAYKLLDHLDLRTIVLAEIAYDSDGIRNLIGVQGAVPKTSQLNSIANGSHAHQTAQSRAQS